MTGDLLRRAAKEMRDRAEAATPEPWALCAARSTGIQIGHDPDMKLTPTHYGKARLENAEHIASWHPAVALGIASLFENLADEWERTRPCEKDCANCSNMRWSWPTAELVAKDFLGETE